MKNERVLSRWGMLMIGCTGPILAGCEGMEIRRTSTPLVELDPNRMTGVTASGRPYRLVGEPEPQYALMAFHSLWNADNDEVRVVSLAEAVALIAQMGNRPFVRSPEEQADIDQQRLDHLAPQMLMQLRSMEIDAETAARRAGLTMEQLHALLQADMTLIGADEADAAFVRLMESEWLYHDAVKGSPGSLRGIGEFCVRLLLGRADCPAIPFMVLDAGGTNAKGHAVFCHRNDVGRGFSLNCGRNAEGANAPRPTLSGGRSAEQQCDMFRLDRTESAQL